MMIQRILPFVKLSLLFVFYIALFIYTLTFPSSFSWIVFYFFTFLFAGSYITTLFSWGKTSVLIAPDMEGTKQLVITLDTKSRLPLLVSRLSFTLSTTDVSLSTEEDVLGKRRIVLTFPAVSFPRGHYSSLKLLTEGSDLLHLFPYVSKKILPAEFEVFPPFLSPSLREKTVQKSAKRLVSPSFFGTNAEQFRQLRTRQEQDSLKDIDWKTSFRTQELMVKEYEKETRHPLVLCLYGSPTAHFEELVSLAYSLHTDLSSKYPIRLLLLGTFEKTIQSEKSVQKLVTIQPAIDEDQLFILWKQSLNRKERRIVIAPKKDLKKLQQSSPQALLLFTEDDLTELEVNK